MNKPETEEKKHVKLLTSVPVLTNCVDISSNNEKERVKIRLLEQTQNIMLFFQDWEKSVMLINCKAAIFQVVFFKSTSFDDISKFFSCKVRVWTIVFIGII